MRALTLACVLAVLAMVAQRANAEAPLPASDNTSAVSQSLGALSHHVRSGQSIALMMRDGSEHRGRFASLDMRERKLCVMARESQCYDVSDVAQVRYWERGHISGKWMTLGLVSGAVLGTVVGAAISNHDRDPSEISDFRGLGTFVGLVLGSGGGLVLGTVIPPLLPATQTLSCCE